MANNLVKRLINPPFGTETSERNLMASAADRIEKLEVALREIRNWDVAYYWNDAGPLASHMQSVARKALEGKDD